MLRSEQLRYREEEEEEEEEEDDGHDEQIVCRVEEVDLVSDESKKACVDSGHVELERNFKIYPREAISCCSSSSLWPSFSSSSSSSSSSQFPLFFLRGAVFRLRARFLLQRLLVRLTCALAASSCLERKIRREALLQEDEPAAARSRFPMLGRGESQATDDRQDLHAEDEIYPGTSGDVAEASQRSLLLPGPCPACFRCLPQEHVGVPKDVSDMQACHLG
eukprot:745959-Hanusia_phi.AAC.3